MFFQPLRLRQLLAEMRPVLPRLLWHQLVPRGIVAAWILAAMAAQQEGPDTAISMLVVLTCYVSLLRVRRPFVSEIMLLERAPVLSRDPTALTVKRRSAMLHRPNAGTLIGRWLVCAVLATLMTVATSLALWFAWWLLVFDQPWGPVMFHVVVPIAMWAVAGYFSVVRFLSYLDLRIRREGWEVELIVKAAATRLKKPLAAGSIRVGLGLIVILAGAGILSGHAGAALGFSDQQAIEAASAAAPAIRPVSLVRRRHRPREHGPGSAPARPAPHKRLGGAAPQAPDAQRLDGCPAASAGVDRVGVGLGRGGHADPPRRFGTRWPRCR